MADHSQARRSQAVIGSASGTGCEVSRSRLVAAHHEAARFFAAHLEAPTGASPREYLHARGLGPLLGSSRWELGYAPPSWTALTNHLRSSGFEDDELVTAGLAVRARTGDLVDRFRDRLMLPIHDLHGEPVGFVSRAAPQAASDTPKYLNSPRTPVFDKSALLFGLYEQQDALSSGAVPVIVEGPLDALAVDLASNQSEADLAAVAPCGTALTAARPAGPRSPQPRSLPSPGSPSPPQDRVEVGVGYTSRRYYIEPPGLDGALAMVSAPTPDRPRAGALSLVEGGQWLLTLMGVLGDHRPANDDDMLRFAADLHLPEIHRALAGAAPLDEPVTHRHPVSVRHRYDQMPTFPDGLTVLGDAACCLNPIYGQGMTVAAMQAATLHEDPHATLRDLARSAQAAWTLAEGADRSFPGVPGRRTPATRVLARYVDRVQAGAAVDPWLGRSFLRVTSLVDSPTALLHPRVLRRLATAAPHRPTQHEGGAA